MNNKIAKNLKDALVKKATGYVAEESVDEMSVDADSGEMKIVKRKITKKHVPPDLNAAKLLYAITGDKTFDFAAMSDEELFAERGRLTILIKKEEENAE